MEAPFVPAIPDSALHVAAKAGDAAEVQISYLLVVFTVYCWLLRRAVATYRTPLASWPEGLQREKLGANAGQVSKLLQRGDDPAVLDDRGRPPYAVAADKDVRDAFRRYMASSDALDWDWAAAGVPSALTPEMEAQQAARQVCLTPPSDEHVGLLYAARQSLPLRHLVRS